MGVAKFLTNAPALQRLRAGEKAELSVLTYGLAPTDILNGRTAVYRTSGVVTIVDTPPIFAPTIFKSRITLSVVFPVAEPFSSVNRLDVSTCLNNGVATEIKSFYMDTQVRTRAVRIGWLNLLGGVDHYTFRGAKSRLITAENSTYIKELAYPVDAEDRGESVLGSSITDERTLVSEFETESTFIWLSEILSSPVVWVVEGGTRLPIVVTSTSVPVENDKLIQMELKYRTANERIAQNG